MLYLLMFLAALSLLKTGAGQTNLEVDLTSCNIAYYGKTYDKLYVTTSSAQTSLCFNDYFQAGSNGDCVILDTGSTVVVAFINDISGASLPLASIQTPMTCYVQIITYGGDFAFPFMVAVTFSNHGTQAALTVQAGNEFTHSSLVISFQVGGQNINQVTLTQAQSQSQTYYDISGCRLSGQVLLTETEYKYPQTCDKAVCNGTAYLQNVTCSPLGFCDGNFQCVSETMCTVTGPAVIDIHGQVSFVQDRCVYELMTPTTSPNIKILAEFRERRRRDVSFLYRLIVQKDSNVIGVVDQYGRVWVDGTLVTLTSTPQLFNNMMLSQDQTGVTLQMSLSFNVTVFFHDNTAQIYINGPAPDGLTGLCSDSSQLSQMKQVGLSNADCATQYNDTADPTIDCTAMSQRCALLMGAPFTTCNINPQPYIQACSYTLCRYPAVDGLKCTFMEAYARDCGLRGNTMMDGWRSSVSCPGPQAFCQGKFCSAHEFCGEKTAGGDTRCFCRAIFASQNGSAFDQTTVCRDNTASVTLVGCLLENLGIDYTTLQLKDETCKGQVDNMTHTVSFTFNGNNTCGTVVTSNGTHMIYTNTIMSHNASGDIVRSVDLLVDFSCFYDQPNTNSFALQINTSSVIQQLRYGQWFYNLTMKVYLDSARTQLIEGVTNIQLNQKIWVELEADGLDNRIVAVVIESCWATHDPLPNGTLRHDLIVNSCADVSDGTVTVESNGQGTTSYFSFNTFRFYGQNGDVYLHCRVQLCGTINNNCVPTCSSFGRRRRSSSSQYAAENSALFTLAWTN